jgi:tRNA dimethylallyltransferase
VPHHLIDVIDLTESFDAAQFVKLAESRIGNLFAWPMVDFLRRHRALFQSVSRRPGRAPPADFELRKELEAMPIAELLRELERRDPRLTRRSIEKNPRRIIRAIEVIRLTGKAFSEQRAKWTSGLRDQGHSRRKIRNP